MAKAKSKSKSKTKSKTKPAKSKAKTAKKSAPRMKAKSSATKVKSAAKKTTPTRLPLKPEKRAPVSSAQFASLFTPLDDRVLVMREGAADRTPGGLYIPDTVSSADRPNQGRVVAVGRGHRDKKGKLRPLDVRLGDQVLFANFGGAEVRLNEQELVCLREDEILAVMKS